MNLEFWSFIFISLFSKYIFLMNGYKEKIYTVVIESYAHDNSSFINQLNLSLYL